jgi:hypothetical protein
MAVRNIYFAVIIGMALALGYAFFSATTVKAGGFATSASQQCVTSTVTAVAIGNQASTRIVATSSRRAFVRIQQPINATNTVSLIANADAPATTATGLQLTAATTTSPIPYMEFGLNTDMNYTGSITGITNTGSSTVLVTQCNF